MPHIIQLIIKEICMIVGFLILLHIHLNIHIKSNKPQADIKPIIRYLISRTPTLSCSPLGLINSYVKAAVTSFELQLNITKLYISACFIILL